MPSFQKNSPFIPIRAFPPLDDPRKEAKPNPISIIKTTENKDPQSNHNPFNHSLQETHSKLQEAPQWLSLWSAECSFHSNLCKSTRFPKFHSKENKRNPPNYQKKKKINLDEIGSTGESAEPKTLDRIAEEQPTYTPLKETTQNVQESSNPRKPKTISNIITIKSSIKERYLHEISSGRSWVGVEGITSSRDKRGGGSNKSRVRHEKISSLSLLFTRIQPPNNQIPNPNPRFRRRRRREWESAKRNEESSRLYKNKS